MRITLVALYDVYSYGIRTIAETLRQEGHKVTCVFFKTSSYIDELWTEEELKTVVDTVEQSDPELIAMGVRSPFRLLAIELCKRFKLRDITAPIVVGGHHATVEPKDCLTFADAVCVGEGDQPMLELANKGFGKISEIQNFYPNPMRPLNQDLDSIPFPHYDCENDILLDADLKFDSVDAPVGLMLMSSRGCFFSCTFCFNESLKILCKDLGRYVRRRSVDNVIAELEMQKSYFPNLKYIPFADNVFPYGPKWIDEFCEKIKDIDIKFRCFGHFKMIDEPMLKKLVDAGLYQVTVGFQHGSARLRKEIFNRHETQKEILEGSKVFADLGIKVRYDLITKISYETERDKLEERMLLQYLARPFTLRRFHLRYYPQTSLTKRALKEGLITQSDIEGQKLPPIGNNTYTYFETYEATK